MRTILLLKKNKDEGKYKPPFVIIFDDGSLNSEELDILNKLLFDNNGIKKILYTSRNNKNYIQHFISKSSIEGIISKRAELETVKGGIIKVSNGERFFCENVIKCISNVGGGKKISPLRISLPKEKKKYWS